MLFVDLGVSNIYFILAPCYNLTIPPNRNRCFIFCFSSFGTISITYTFLVTFMIKQIINCYKYSQNKTLFPDSEKDVSLVKYDIKWFSIICILDFACRFSNTAEEYP